MHVTSLRMRRSYQANLGLKEPYGRHPTIEEELECSRVGLRNVYLQHMNFRPLLSLHIYVHPVMIVTFCHYSYTCNHFSNGQWRLQLRAPLEEECDRLVS